MKTLAPESRSERQSVSAKMSPLESHSERQSVSAKVSPLESECRLVRLLAKALMSVPQSASVQWSPLDSVWEEELVLVWALASTLALRSASVAASAQS